jgi:hypothetical protein
MAGLLADNPEGFTTAVKGFAYLRAQRLTPPRKTGTAYQLCSPSSLLKRVDESTNAIIAPLVTKPG